MLKRKLRSTAADFTTAVIAVVQSIKPGETLSYTAVATKAGNSHAARRVARIMSQNYDDTIPCHRVIYRDGRIGHYNRGGETAKRALLLSEGWTDESTGPK